MEGPLSKWTNVMKGWQYRWLVLDDRAGILSYYTSRDKMVKGVRRGCVHLRGAVVGISSEDDSTFTIRVDSKTFNFQARNAEERERWVRSLEDTITRHAYGKSSSTLWFDTSKTSPTDFERKVAEADGFLQILIDQVRLMETRLGPIVQGEDKTKYELMLSHANNMLEHVKHTIVSLQIAKNTINPMHAVCRPRTSHSMTTTEQVGSSAPRTSSVPNVPSTSYSTSEDEDYYDAHENTYQPVSRPSTPSLDCEDSNEGQASSSNQLPRGSSSDSGFLRPDGTVDYDAIYEDYTEGDVSFESQRSVVSHILSQVRIGMDLTKVVLPTFILERRSLLEMYADFFAYPSMFVDIAERKSERDRMVQVVKWYLCSYSAGKKTGVAKKPYNPVLGEIFQCYWNLDDRSPSKDPVVDGPIPWCRRNQLAFVAEQVSHHPPISAFYAEHYNKRISFNAHIWTRSKFLGLSIGVHNVGFGTVHLLDHEEKYVVTFPSGYGRSILSVPWFELGGEVCITCEKTGYRAEIEFQPKPFYGGKKHRILGVLFAPKEKKPFLSISGEWNGYMEAKWSDGRTEVFQDVEQLSPSKKMVRPVDQQLENESRRIWKEVTAGLRLNNVALATNAKNIIEQRQRDKAQERKNKGELWNTQLFRKETDDRWEYIKPLSSRVKCRY